MQVKVKDFSLDMVKDMVEILNRGNEVLLKVERTNIVIVENRRKAISKNPISELQ